MKLFWIVLFLTPCFFLCAKRNPDAEDHGRRVVAEFTAMKTPELGCSTYSVGGGFLGNMVNKLRLDLALQRELSVEEAREVYVNILVDFIDFVAKDQQIRPFLHHCPPAAKEIGCSLRFFQAKRSDHPPLGKVATMGVGTNRMLFFSTDDGNLKHPLQDLHEESLLEAIEIMRKAGKLHEYPWLNEWLVQEKWLLEQELLKKQQPPSS